MQELTRGKTEEIQRLMFSIETGKASIPELYPNATTGSGLITEGQDPYEQLNNIVNELKLDKISRQDTVCWQYKNSIKDHQWKPCTRDEFFSLQVLIKHGHSYQIRELIVKP